MKYLADNFIALKKTYGSVDSKDSEIAKGFIDHHLARMDTLDLVNYEMWRKYRAGDYKALDALSKIAEAQPLISNYYDVTKLMIEDQEAKIKRDKEFREHLDPPPGMNTVKVDKKGEIYWTKPDEDIMDVVAKTDEESTKFNYRNALIKFKQFFKIKISCLIIPWVSRSSLIHICFRTEVLSIS